MINKLQKVKLGELLTDFTNKNKQNESIPVYSVTNEFGFKISTEYFTKEVFSHNLKTYKIVKNGDFAYNPSRINVGSIDYFKNEGKGLISPLYVTFRVNKKTDRRYLKYFLKSSYGNAQIRNNTSGSVRDNLGFKQLSRIQMPFPPIEDQKRIVKILDMADALRQKRKQAIALLDEYLKSVFLEMFGDPVKNPKGWESIRLKFLIKEIVAGWSANGENRLKLQNEYGVLKISSVTYGLFNPQEYKAVRTTDINNKKLVHPKKGSILFSRANTRELVGASCVVAKDYPNLFLPDKLWEITVDTSKINSVFFQKGISNIRWKNELAKKATGTSGSMLNISMEKFRNEQIVVPPIEMQIKFAEIVQKAELIKKRMLTQAEELETQFQALMQKAFKGEL